MTTGLRFLAGLSVLVLVGLALRRRANPALDRDPVLGEKGPLLLENRSDTLRGQGFFKLVPAVRLPGRRAEGMKTEVWIRIPEGVEVAWDSATDRLVFPLGTEAARVESIEVEGTHALTVLDIRATRIAAAGQYFRVFRPTSPAAFAELRGLEWQRGSQTEQLRADEWIRGAAAAAVVPSARDEVTQKAVADNDCAACHRAARPDAQAVHQFGLVHRGTDASGFFTATSVLMDEAPLEDYAPRELNVGDPFVEVTCPLGEPKLRGEAPLQHYGCPERQVPRARYHLLEALQQGESHARDVCSSRLALREHLDERTLQVFRRAIEECEGA